ncbi:hypothetical protein AAVH_19523 [Aphelenchoides avenae]|nr:hypothetical protein AAVH_19522 [Aphelenchus avenae]KAH7713124.1 hypothetical protein AAVH_19523 [Aphelenchus avenae]
MGTSKFDGNRLAGARLEDVLRRPGTAQESPVQRGATKEEAVRAAAQRSALLRLRVSIFPRAARASKTNDAYVVVDDAAASTKWPVVVAAGSGAAAPENRCAVPPPGAPPDAGAEFRHGFLKRKITQ